MVRCDVWRRKGEECWKETIVDREMEELSINDEIGLMCGGIAEDMWEDKGGWMNGWSDKVQG